MWSIVDTKALHALKSEAGALLSSWAKRRQLEQMEVEDGGGVRAIFTRRMMEQLREGKTPGPWRLITADRGVKFSRSIPSRCCCYCWSASNILFVEKGGQQTQTSAIRPPKHRRSSPRDRSTKASKSVSPSPEAAEMHPYCAAIIQLWLCLPGWLHHMCLQGILQQLMGDRAAGGSTGAHFVTKDTSLLFLSARSTDWNALNVPPPTYTDLGNTRFKVRETISAFCVLKKNSTGATLWHKKEKNTLNIRKSTFTLKNKQTTSGVGQRPKFQQKKEIKRKKEIIYNFSLMSNNEIICFRVSVISVLKKRNSLTNNFK